MYVHRKGERQRDRETERKRKRGKEGEREIQGTKRERTLEKYIGFHVLSNFTQHESTTALRAALAVVEHSLPGFESHRQQLHWPCLTAQTHAATLLQLNVLAASLRKSSDRLSLGADSRVTLLPALTTRLYIRCCRDPLEKYAHRSWWKTMVMLCSTAQRTKAKIGTTRTTWQSKR